MWQRYGEGVVEIGIGVRTFGWISLGKRKKEKLESC